MGLNLAEYRSSEAVKTWMAGGERRFDTFTIAEYGLYDEAQTDERELEEALKTQGLQAAMNLAEQMAVAGGYLDPQRADGRVFFEDDAPPDPFTTVREREWQRALENGDVTLNAEYHIAAIAANDEARLDVLKRWGEGDLQRQALLIPQPDWETARANAEFATEQLEAGDLQGAMTLVELAEIEAGVLDPDRADPRLFTQGPPDPFTTIRERELAQAVDITELNLIHPLHRNPKSRIIRPCTASSPPKPRVSVRRTRRWKARPGLRRPSSRLKSNCCRRWTTA